jgi:hypothetical protein
MVEAIIIWILSIFCGVLVGKGKGQLASGIIWTVLFGPIGLVVVLSLPNLIKAANERAQQEMLQQRLSLQKQQIEELKRLRSSTIVQASPPAASRPHLSETLRIGRGEQDLGELTIVQVKAMLRSGELSLEDSYYDWDAQQWLPLDGCLKL